MLRRTGLLAAAGALGIAAFVVWSAPGATGPALIRITSTQASYDRVDSGTSGSSQGDDEFIKARLYNRRITQRSIGRSELVCTFTFGTSRSCRGTYFLPQGRIVVGGGIGNREIYELAILGGTGLYNNARGTLTVTRTARRPRREFLIFRLAG
jgi:hypothetical protein